jgi:predicted nucleic acid-binding protein
LAYSFFMDASSLAKRYVPETGSPLVDEILNNVPGRRLYLLMVGAGEIVWVLVRKKNAGSISATEFEQALLDLETEIIRPRAIKKMAATNRLVLSSFSLVVTHSINSTDAIALKSALAIADKLRARGDDLVLVASDQRLLRAAQAEGLATFNPESQGQAALAAFIRP